MKLENFNHQNVINGLEISNFSDNYFEKIKNDVRLLGVVSETEIERLNFYVKFEYCFGVEAEFLCQSVVIDSVELMIDEENKRL